MVDSIFLQLAQFPGKHFSASLPLHHNVHAESCLQIFNDSVDAFQSWTLFLIFVSILILISGVVLLTHKKPESSATPRDGGIALNAIPGRQIPRTADDKAGGHEDLLPDDHGEDGQAVWDVGEASDDEDESTTVTPRFESLGKVSHGEEGEHLMTSSHEDGDDTQSRRPTRRRSTSSVLRRDNDQDRDDADGFGAFEGA